MNERRRLYDHSFCLAKVQKLQYGPLPPSNAINPNRASISGSDQQFESGKAGATHASVSGSEGDATDAVLADDLGTTQSDYDYMDIDPSEYANDDYCGDGVLVGNLGTSQSDYEYMDVDSSEYKNDDYYGNDYEDEEYEDEEYEDYGYKDKVLERESRILKWRDEVYELIPLPQLYMMQNDDFYPYPMTWESLPAGLLLACGSSGLVRCDNQDLLHIIVFIYQIKNRGLWHFA
jgi:hypothetical protein